MSFLGTATLKDKPLDSSVVIGRCLTIAADQHHLFFCSCLEYINFKNFLSLLYQQGHRNTECPGACTPPPTFIMIKSAVFYKEK